MAKRKDLIGRRFTKLTVLSFAYVNNKHRACWLCQCDCGNTRVYSTDALIQGHAKSCGCMPHKPITDLTGKTFNNLYVIGFDRLDRQSFWLCRCLLCGRETVIRCSDITTGHSQSCGCTRGRDPKPITWDVDPITGCWNCNSHSWAGRGYPVALRNGIFEPISRIHYKQYNGDIPKGMCVRHTCDNIKCINPNHLLIGTTQDNANDKVERNRQLKGETIPCSKLTNEEVVAIYLNTTTSRQQLARQYNISTSNINVIKSGRSWQHITLPLQLMLNDPTKDLTTPVMSGETVFNDGDDPEVFSCEWSSDDYLKELGYVKDEG